MPMLLLWRGRIDDEGVVHNAPVALDIGHVRHVAAVSSLSLVALASFKKLFLAFMPILQHSKTHVCRSITQWYDPITEWLIKAVSS